MFKISSSGDFKKTKDFINRAMHHDVYSSLDRFGQLGVAALARATPVETGLTGSGWYYKIVRTRKYIRIEWYNNHKVHGVSIAVLLQYGHATGTGGYVQGRDFINPALRPVFDQIADDVWKKVTAK